MATTTQVQWRRNPASLIATFVGAQGEIVVDTTNNRIVIQDGTTQGGWTGALLSDVYAIVSNYTGGGASVANVVYQSGNQTISGFKFVQSGYFYDYFGMSHTFNSASNLNLSSTPFYINTSTSSTNWILPPLIANANKFYFLKNRGNTITLSGTYGDSLWTTQQSLSMTINSGESYIVANDGIYCNIM